MDPGAFPFQDILQDSVRPQLCDTPAPAASWRDVFVPSQYKKRTRDSDSSPVLTCVDDPLPKRATSAPDNNLFKFKSKPIFAQVFKTQAPAPMFPDLDSFFSDAN
jgi:hypothetical protein